MKLQKRLSRIYNGKEYYKYILVIPKKEVEKSGLDVGESLLIKSKKGELIIFKTP